MKYTDLCAQADKALEGVTEGPWENGIDTVILPPEGPAVALMGIHCPPDTRAANARFIAFTRAWVPAAAAAIRELEAEWDKLNMRACNADRMLTAAEAKVAELTAERESVEALVKAADGIMPLIDVDYPDLPDDDTVGWCGEEDIPVTFGQVRAFFAALAAIRKGATP